MDANDGWLSIAGKATYVLDQRSRHRADLPCPPSNDPILHLYMGITSLFSSFRPHTDDCPKPLISPLSSVPHILLRTHDPLLPSITNCTLVNLTFPRRITDEKLIEKLYNPTISAWFGDKGDGVHTGKPSDPRMAVVEVRIDEIRHFHQVKTTIGTLVDVVSSAVSGSTATPGQIRTITGGEISSAWSKGELKEP